MRIIFDICCLKCQNWQSLLYFTTDVRYLLTIAQSKHSFNFLQFFLRMILNPPIIPFLLFHFETYLFIIRLKLKSRDKFGHLIDSKSLQAEKEVQPIHKQYYISCLSNESPMLVKFSQETCNTRNKFEFCYYNEIKVMIIKQKLGKESPVKRQKPLMDDKYVFLQTKSINKGKFDCLLKAENSVSNKQVAIEVVSSRFLQKKGLNQDVIQKITLLKKLNHPNIVKQLDCYQEDSNWHLITQYCSEDSLNSQIQRKKQLIQSEAKNYIIGILKGLIYLDKQGIVHPNLQSSKVLISEDEAKITGFGYEFLFKTNLQKFKGESMFYLSPQVYFLQKNDPKSVVWCFGVIIYEMLHGKKPFPTFSDETQLSLLLLKQLNESIFSNSQTTQQLKQIILKCLTVDVDERPSLQELTKLRYFREYFTTDQRVDLPRKQQKQYLQWEDLLNQHFQDIPEQKHHQQRKNERMDGMKANEPKRGSQSNVVSILKSIKSEDLSEAADDQILHNLVNQKIKSMTQIKNSGTFEQENLISGALNYQQTIKILHYCRLVYKSIQLMRTLKIKEEVQLTVMQNWLLLLLSSLLSKLQQPKNRLKSFQKDKLVIVIEGYLNNYMAQFTNVGNYRANEKRISYKKMFNYFQTVKQRLLINITECVERQKLVLSHYIVIICYVTHVIWQCFVQKDYSLLGRVHEMQRAIKMSTNANSLRSLKILINQYSF